MRLIDVLHARHRIAPYVHRTPLIASKWLSDLAGTHVSLKLESLQPTNSFKVRGAFNAVIARLERGHSPKEQIVTASAGNHGRALAMAASTFGVPLVVFTPAGAPRSKLAAIAQPGVELRAEGRDYDHAELLGRTFSEEHGVPFVSPYNDPDVIAGAGTVAMEILEDDPGVDMVVVPIGGGGLVGGVSVAAKAIAPAVRTIGVEADASHPFLTSVRAGRLVTITPEPTLADGLAGNPDPQTITFAIIQQHVDQIVTVSESNLATSIVGLVEHEHVIAEGAGAAAVAAIAGRRVHVEGRRLAVIVTGSNIDLDRLRSLLARE
jgi:threonine dehydratase